MTTARESLQIKFYYLVEKLFSLLLFFFLKIINVILDDIKAIRVTTLHSLKSDLICRFRLVIEN